MPPEPAAAPAKSNLSHSGLQALLESARLLNASPTLDELLSHLIRTAMGRLLVSRRVIAIEDKGEMPVDVALPIYAVFRGSIIEQEARLDDILDVHNTIESAPGPVGALALGLQV